nr:hypothetical protein [Tanacetum cinerariifolium]
MEQYYCPKPKRKRDATRFRDKVLQVEAQGSGKFLNVEELEFLADSGVTEANQVLMANLSSYGSYVLSEIPYSDNTYNDMLNQSVDKVLQVEAQGSGKFLNVEELEFLADSGVTEANQVLMANLSSYGSYVLSEIPYSNNTYNDMLNQSV